MDEGPKNDENFSERNSTNENDAQNSPNRGDDIIVPEISQDDDRNENLSPRGGRYNLRPNPNPNYSEDFKYWKEVNSAQKWALFFFSLFFVPGQAVSFE